MKYISLFLLLTVLSCSKTTEPECITWQTTYWQGKADHTTVTTNYYPYKGEKEICGSGKDTVYKNKIIVIRQVGSNLFDYMTFEAPKN
jgi:hypothetical protein